MPNKFFDAVKFVLISLVFSLLRLEDHALADGFVSKTAVGVTYATNLVGLISSSSLPSEVVTNIILSPSGTNDQSATIQSAFDANNSYIWFKPGNYYATNLWITTTNVMVSGYGACLYQLAASSQTYYQTGADAVLMKTNLNSLINISGTNVSIFGLTLDGGKPAYYQRTAGTEDTTFPIYSGANNGLYAECVPFASVGQNTNNYGIVFDVGGGGTVANCYTRNFAYCGYLIHNRYGASAQLHTIGNFYANEAINNYVGFSFRSRSAASGPYGNAEYVIAGDLTAIGCTFGFSGSPSNLELHDSQANSCYVGLNLTGGTTPNAGPHTRYSNIKLNHNYCGIAAGPSDAVWLDNIYEAATTTNFITTLPNIYFSACDLAPIFIDCTASNSAAQSIHFRNSRVGRITARGARLEFENSMLYGKSTATNSVVSAYGNSAAFAFTNWGVDVITNLNNSCEFYQGFNRGAYGTNSMSFTGLLGGNGAGLTNFNSRIVYTNFTAADLAVVFAAPFSPDVGTNYTIAAQMMSAPAGSVADSIWYDSITTNGFSAHQVGIGVGALDVRFTARPDYQ